MTTITKKTDFECEFVLILVLEIPGFVDQIVEAVFDKNYFHAEFLVNGSAMLFKPQ
jgi:hypothetical protein